MNDYDADIEGFLQRNSLMTASFDCGERLYTVKFNLLTIFPPGLTDDLRENEKRDLFLKSFEKEPILEDGLVYGEFGFGRLGIKYGSSLLEPPFKVETENVVEMFNEIAFKFIPCIKNSETRIIKEEVSFDLDVPGRKYWFRNDRCGIVTMFVSQDGFLGFEYIGEGFYD